MRVGDTRGLFAQCWPSAGTSRCPPIATSAIPEVEFRSSTFLSSFNFPPFLVCNLSKIPHFYSQSYLLKICLLNSASDCISSFWDFLYVPRFPFFFLFALSGSLRNFQKAEDPKPELRNLVQKDGERKEIFKNSRTSSLSSKLPSLRFCVDLLTKICLPIPSFSQPKTDSVLTIPVFVMPEPDFVTNPNYFYQILFFDSNFTSTEPDFPLQIPALSNQNRILLADSGCRIGTELYSLIPVSSQPNADFVSKRLYSDHWPNPL